MVMCVELLHAIGICAMARIWCGIIIHTIIGILTMGTIIPRADTPNMRNSPKPIDHGTEWYIGHS